jgi:hypothetical protein
MEFDLRVDRDHCVLVVSGSISTVDVPRVRGRILDLFGECDGDLLLDLRRAGPVCDHLVAALAAGRTRAKLHGRNLVVIDDSEGAVTASLRRQKMHFRIPIYGDPDAALAGVRGDRRALDEDRPGGCSV